MNETFGWVLILIFSTMGAIMYLHARLTKAEQQIVWLVAMNAKAAALLDDMSEEQQRLIKTLQNYVAWEEDDGQTETNSS